MITTPKTEVKKRTKSILSFLRMQFVRLIVFLNFVANYFDYVKIILF